MCIYIYVYARRCAGAVWWSGRDVKIWNDIYM